MDNSTPSIVPGPGPDSPSQAETAITVAPPSEPATGSPSASFTPILSPVVRVLPSHFNYDYAEHADGSRSPMMDEKLLPTPEAPPEEIVLRTQQQIALSTLMRTGSIQEASEFAEVARSTIYRWMKSDERFKEALKRCEQRQAIFVRKELLAIAGKAAYNVRYAIGRGDLRASLIVLRQLGILDKKMQEEPEEPPLPAPAQPSQPAQPEAPPPPSGAARRRKRRRARKKAYDAAIAAGKSPEEAQEAARLTLLMNEPADPGLDSKAQEEPELPASAQSGPPEPTASVQALAPPPLQVSPGPRRRSIDEIRRARKRAFDFALATGKSPEEAKQAARLELHLFEPDDLDSQ